MHKVAAFICTILLLTSCFDIREELVLNRNGSGVYQITLTCHDSLLSMFSGEDSVQMLEKTDATLQSEVARLRAINGIHNVNYSYRDGGKIWRLGFEFQNATALNAALNADSGRFDYTFANKTFFLPGGLPALAGLRHAGDDPESGAENFKNARYSKNILSMAKIKSCTPPQVKLSKNSIQIQSSLMQAIQNPGSGNVQIRIR